MLTAHTTTGGAHTDHTTTQDAHEQSAAPLAYALADAAALLGIGADDLLALIERGTVAAVALGDHLLVERAELDRVLAAHRTVGGQPFAGRDYISPAEAAAYAGVSRDAICKLFRGYQFPGSMKVGSRVRIKTASFLTWCEAGGSLRRHGDAAPTPAEEYLVRGSRMRAIEREMLS